MYIGGDADIDKGTFSSELCPRGIMMVFVPLPAHHMLILTTELETNISHVYLPNSVAAVKFQSIYIFLNRLLNSIKINSDIFLLMNEYWEAWWILHTGYSGIPDVLCHMGCTFFLLFAKPLGRSESPPSKQGAVNSFHFKGKFSIWYWKTNQQGNTAPFVTLFILFRDSLSQ